MAPVNIAVPAARRPLVDVVLARHAAKQLTDVLPGKPRRQIEADVLGRLALKREERAALGLNHWGEHAVIAVEAVLREVQEADQEERHRREEFYRANHASAMVYAYAALKDRSEAEDTVAETYVELLEGRTTEEHFFRALKLNIIDRQRRKALERARLEPTERVFDPRHLPGEDIMSGGCGDKFSIEPGSSRLDDQDPMEILIRREERAVRESMVQRALTDPRWRYIKRRGWAQQLKRCAESTPSRE